MATDLLEVAKQTLRLLAGGKRLPDFKLVVSDVNRLLKERHERRSDGDGWYYPNALVRWIELGGAVALAQRVARRLLQDDPNLLDYPEILLAQTRFAVVHAVRLEEGWSGGMPDFAARPDWPTAERLRLGMIAEVERSKLPPIPDSWAWRNPESYLTAVGFLLKSKVTSAGELFLRLQDLEATRWLLFNESIRSLADESESCLTPVVARQLLESMPGRQTLQFRLGTEDTKALDVQLPRLRDLNLVTLSLSGVGQVSVQINELARPILAEVAGITSSPMLSLASALKADSNAEILAVFGGPVGATAASRMVEGEIARSISHLKHELRNKLTPAVGQLDVLVDASAEWGHWDRDSLHIARDSVRDALKFVDGMARTVAGMSANPEWFAFGAAVRDGVRQGRNGNRSAKVGLVAELDEWDAYGRREDVVLIVANLVRNALQAGATTLQFDADDDGAGSGLCLRVSDDGTGVHAADKVRIFDRGYSGGQGSGEGLWLARQTAERRLAGTLTLEVGPNQDKGTTFALRLPADKVRHAEDEKEKP